MNSNQLFGGEHYAWVTYPRRRPGVLYTNASRVRVIRTLSCEIPHQTKRITMVEVEFMKEDGTPREPEMFRTVRARQIVYRWDEHWHMLSEYRKEREEQDRIFREQQEELHRREQERLARVRAELEPIYKLFEGLGIDRKYITINSFNVGINRRAVEEVVNDKSVV